MCTLAWGLSGEGLWVVFNRDEQRKRPVAELPEVHAVGSKRAIYAKDPAGGGTWFAATSAGLVVALLNRYPPDERLPVPGIFSRGQLVLELAESDDINAAIQHLKSVRLESYAPFHLFLLSLNGQHYSSWEGSELSDHRDCPHFLTTSSYRSREVETWREKRWETLAGDSHLRMSEVISLLEERSVDPAFGMTMDRTDARTVSRIELMMNPQGQAFAYYPREADGLGFQHPVCLTNNSD
jgi:uncharacterized protein with NRDE domain